MGANSGRRVTVPVLIVGGALLCAGLAGCETSDPQPAPSGGLRGALEAVPADDAFLTSIAWTDVSAAAEFGAYDDPSGPFATAGGIGYGRLATLVSVLDPALLPDPDSGEAAATSVGTPPNTVIRFDGVDSAAAEGFFDGETGESEELGGGTLLVRRPDGEIDPADELLPPQVLAQLNTVWIGEGTLIGATTRAGASALVAGGDESAADSPAYAGVADCLGEVVAAQVNTGEAVRPARSIGMGFGGTVDESVTTLCVLADDAGATAEAIRDQLANGAEPTTGQPWSDVFGEGEVEESGEWVRVRFVAPERPAAVYQAFNRGVLGVLLGG